MPQPRATFEVRTRRIDAVPEPRASTRGRYRAVLEQVEADGISRDLVCPDRESGHAVYVGMKRAVDGHDHPDHFTVTSRVSPDGDDTVLVIVSYNPHAPP